MLPYVEGWETPGPFPYVNTGWTWSYYETLAGGTVEFKDTPTRSGAYSLALRHPLATVQGVSLLLPASLGGTLTFYTGAFNGFASGSFYAGLYLNGTWKAELNKGSSWGLKTVAIPATSEGDVIRFDIQTDGYGAYFHIDDLTLDLTL